MPYPHRRRLRRRHPSIHDRRSNESSVSAASEPFYDGSRSFGIDGSWIDGPNRPTPTTAALRRLQDKRAAPQSKPSRLDLEEAFGLIHEALESTHITTIPCLGRSSDTESRFSARDLPFMVFDDLDRKLFRSTLKGNVHLTWANLPQGVRGRTSRPGLRGRPRITIKLSLRVAKDRAATLGVLLHQMIHAYYLQSCGHKNKGVVGKGHDLRHKEEYENLRRSIKEHFLPGEKPVWDAANDLLPVEANVSYYPPEAGCSDCYYRSSCVKKVSVDRWRMAALALAIARSARRVASGSGGEGGSNDSSNRSAESINERFYFVDLDGSSRKQTSQPHCPFAPGTYITLIYMERRYPIRKQDLHDPEGLSKSQFFIIDTLFFPSTASFDDFGILYSYLKNGEVAPTRAATRNFSANVLPYGSSLNIIEKQGPPVMLQPMANSMPYLAASIAAYKLGNTLHFESLKNSAISRLYGLPCTSEDPIPLLEQVYKPEQDLALPVRVWAKDWLARPTDASLPSEYANTYPTNLHFLQRHPELVARFSRLVQKSPDLAWDISTLTADAARSQASADSPREQRTWLAKQTGTFLPFVNLPAPPHLNRSDQWPSQSNFESRFDELYRKRQDLEAAQRQYMFDVERGVLPERPMAYASSSQHGQVHDANLADRMRDLHMGNPRP